MKKLNLKTEKGFTLIEVMVVIGIFGILTAIAVINYGSFQSAVLLNNMAYEVALTIRQAQTYGVSVRNFALKYNSPYGAYIDINAPEEIKLFADADGNGYCNDGSTECDCSGTDDECVERSEMQKKISIYRICFETVVDGDFNCSSAKKASITFKRPNPDAKFMIYDGSTWLSEPDGNNDIKVLKIDIQTPDGSIQRSIRVNRLGQVTVENVEP